MRAHWLLAVTLIVAANAHAQTNLNQAIDALFTDIDQGSAPGCVAGVIHKGEYIHQAGYGLANLEYNIPITEETIFRTGSIGKQFTAMAIALLAERGDLDLDADVHTYLPDLMDYGHEVTIRQMVHHIAGMGDYDHAAFNKADGSEFRFGNEDFWTIKEFYEHVSKADLKHAPGEKYEYSNLGYFLLGQVVESVSGLTLREFAAAEIFGPLGMSSTRFNDNVNQIVVNRADGYRQLEDESWEIFMTNLSWVGDGGVYTNLEDFIKWDQNFYSNRLGEGGQSLIDLVETPHPVTTGPSLDLARGANYGFGLRQQEQNGEWVIGHTGGWVAFSTVYHRYPDLEMSVIVFCNSTEVYGPELGIEIGAIAVEVVRQSD